MARSYSLRIPNDLPQGYHVALSDSQLVIVIEPGAMGPEDLRALLLETADAFLQAAHTWPPPGCCQHN